MARILKRLTSFSDISQENLIETYLGNAEDYQVEQFENNGQTLIFQASYISDQNEYRILESAIVNNQYLYEITLISPASGFESDYPVYEQVLGNVRLF